MHSNSKCFANRIESNLKKQAHFQGQLIVLVLLCCPQVDQSINQSINQSIFFPGRFTSLLTLPVRSFIFGHWFSRNWSPLQAILSAWETVGWQTSINKLRPSHVKRVRPTLWEEPSDLYHFNARAGYLRWRKSLRVSRSISISRPQAKTHVLFQRIELLIVVYHAACVIPDVYVVVFLLPMFVPVCICTGPSTTNWPRSIYQYSNMTPRLSGQNCKFLI